MTRIPDPWRSVTAGGEEHICQYFAAGRAEAVAHAVAWSAEAGMTDPVAVHSRDIGSGLWTVTTRPAAVVAAKKAAR
jgi:hypothetical protein